MCPESRGNEMIRPQALMRRCHGLWSSIVSWIETPIDPRPLALFRFWFGVLCLVNLVLLWPDMDMWFANDGVLPAQLHRSMNSELRFSFYTFTGYQDWVIATMRVSGVIGSIGLITGLFPRVSAFLLWMMASSYSWRNSGILHSGDSLIRITCFFLMFARSDGAFSLSSKLFGTVEPKSSSLVPAWPQRILQLQLCVVYLVSAVIKFKGSMWRDGTAVGMVLQLGEFERFPIPDFLMTPLASAVATYFTLGFEFLFPFLVWVPGLRIPMLLSGLMLHGGLEWTMNVQMFQWVITSFYLLFLRFDNKSVTSHS